MLFPIIVRMINYCKDDHLEAEAYCDTSNGGGGWLVVQRRQDGSVDFNRGWGEYVTGYWKTDHNVTLGQLYFIGPANSHTHALSMHHCIIGLS